MVGFGAGIFLELQRIMIRLSSCLFLGFIILVASYLFATPCSYVLRGAQSFFQFKTYIDVIDLNTNQCVASYKVPPGISQIVMNKNGNFFFLFKESPNDIKPVHEIQEYALKGKKLSIAFRNKSMDPVDVFFAKNHYFFLFDLILKSPEDIQKYPNLVPYQYAGFEVYANKKNLSLLGYLRLGEFDHVEGCDLNADQSKLYIVADPYNIVLKTGGGIYNKESISFLYIVDTQTREIIKKKELTPFFKGVQGLKVVGEKVYMGALYKKSYTGKKELVNQDLNKNLFVFDIKTLSLIKKFHLEAMVRKIEYSPDDKRLFVMHQGQLGSCKAALTVVDTIHDKPVSLFEIPNLEEIRYVGCHKLFLVTHHKLLILNTKTLKIEKEFSGTYWSIAKKL